MERLLHLGGVSGVENVYLGRDGWLLDEPDVRYVLAGDFSDHKASAIERAVRPTRRPIRLRRSWISTSSSPPGGLRWCYRADTGQADDAAGDAGSRAQGPLQNAAFGRFKDDLEKHGVPVFDIAVQVSAEVTLRQYLATDTHWGVRGDGAGRTIACTIRQRPGACRNRWAWNTSRVRESFKVAGIWRRLSSSRSVER